MYGLGGQEIVSWSPGFSYLLTSTSEFIMSISKCIVRLKDCHNTEHSVEVYAESLYEAVLRGLSRLEVVGKMDMAERVGLYPTQFVVGTRWDAFFRYRNLLHPKDLF